MARIVCADCGRAIVEMDGDYRYVGCNEYKTDGDELFYQRNDGEFICEECFDENYFQCEDCNAIYPRDEECYEDGADRSVCPACDEYYAPCECCDERYESSGMRETIDDGFVCDRCYDRHYYTCCECGNAVRDRDVVRDDHGDHYCLSCYDEHFTRCCECDEELYLDDAHETPNGQMCESCIERLGYVQCSRCGDYVPPEEIYTCSDGRCLCNYCSDIIRRESGMSPEEWASSLSIGEVGVIRFDTGGKETFVNMVKCGNPSAAGDTAVMKKYDYPGFLASLFGSVFSLAEEDYCVSVSGWLAIGPESAMRDFLNGSALELDLARYLSDAGLSDAFPSKSLLTVYLNVASDPDGLTSPFKTPLARSIAEGAAGHTVDMYAYSLVSGKNGAVPSLKVRLSDYEVPTVSRFDRDTVVVIPKGPWKVKNCGTGRTNLMYQQDNMYICLTEENGKGIWSAPFSSPICGNIDQLDYFENGKLQMIFASGSKLYVIDRLGRMVRPFPVDLGKEILLGPQVYDFNQNRKYNVMVLHTDNTLGLYDLKGRLRDDWVGFDTDETIKKLPRLMEINSSLYWVVTTSLQTVICDFTGKPVADFSGSKKMRPDVRIEPYAGNSVEIETYDGKMWVLDLKSGEFSRR